MHFALLGKYERGMVCILIVVAEAISFSPGSHSNVFHRCRIWTRELTSALRDLTIIVAALGPVLDLEAKKLISRKGSFVIIQGNKFCASV